MRGGTGSVCAARNKCYFGLKCIQVTCKMQRGMYDVHCTQIMWCTWSIVCSVLDSYLSRSWSKQTENDYVATFGTWQVYDACVCIEEILIQVIWTITEGRQYPWARALPTRTTPHQDHYPWIHSPFGHLPTRTIIPGMVGTTPHQDHYPWNHSPPGPLSLELLHTRTIIPGMVGTTPHQDHYPWNHSPPGPLSLELLHTRTIIPGTTSHLDISPPGLLGNCPSGELSEYKIEPPPPSPPHTAIS